MFLVNSHKSSTSPKKISKKASCMLQIFLGIQFFKFNIAIPHCVFISNSRNVEKVENPRQEDCERSINFYICQCAFESLLNNYLEEFLELVAASQGNPHCFDLLWQCIHLQCLWCFRKAPIAGRRHFGSPRKHWSVNWWMVMNHVIQNSNVIHNSNACKMLFDSCLIDMMEFSSSLLFWCQFYINLHIVWMHRSLALHKEINFHLFSKQ